MGTVQNAESNQLTQLVLFFIDYCIKYYFNSVGPLSTLAIENLVYINFTMRDLIAEANKVDKRALESQHTLKTWSNIFRNELDAKQVNLKLIHARGVLLVCH